LDKEKEKNKELFIAPLMTVPNLELFLNNFDENDTLFIDPTKLKKRKNFKIIYESELADIIICKSMDDLIKNKTKDKALAYYKKVFSNKDIDDIESAINTGANYIIVDADDWKIIPLENIIANLQNTRTKIAIIWKSQCNNYLKPTTRASQKNQIGTALSLTIFNTRAAI